MGKRDNLRVRKRDKVDSGEWGKTESEKSEQG